MKELSLLSVIFRDIFLKIIFEYNLPELLSDEQSFIDETATNNPDNQDDTSDDELVPPPISKKAKKKKKKKEQPKVIDIKKVLQTTTANVADGDFILNELCFRYHHKIKNTNNSEDTIAAAFEDDDLVDEFRHEKAKIIGDETPQDIDLTLPGWGDWSGGPKWDPAKEREKNKNRRWLFLNYFTSGVTHH